MTKLKATNYTFTFVFYRKIMILNRNIFLELNNTNIIKEMQFNEGIT